jgi:hypothetical protein
MGRVGVGVGPSSELGAQCSGFLSRGAQAEAKAKTPADVKRLHRRRLDCEARDEQRAAKQRAVQVRRALEIPLSSGLAWS